MSVGFDSAGADVDARYRERAQKEGSLLDRVREAIWRDNAAARAEQAAKDEAAKQAAKVERSNVAMASGIMSGITEQHDRQRQLLALPTAEEAAVLLADAVASQTLASKAVAKAQRAVNAVVKKLEKRRYDQVAEEVVSGELAQRITAALDAEQADPSKSVVIAKLEAQLAGRQRRFTHLAQQIMGDEAAVNAARRVLDSRQDDLTVAEAEVVRARWLQVAGDAVDRFLDAITDMHSEVQQRRADLRRVAGGGHAVARQALYATADPADQLRAALADVLPKGK